MGLRPFSRLLNDPRFAAVVGVVELPPTEIRRGREVRVLGTLLDRLRGLVGAASEAPARATKRRPASVPARRRP